jgi:branched-chain amino acid transport system ATP-binding protein
MSQLTENNAMGAESTAEQPMLKLLNVESAYGPIKAIRGVSLQVKSARC